jgi:urease accessory protein UreE
MRLNLPSKLVVLSENAANVKKMRANLEESTVIYSCSSHLMNLSAHNLKNWHILLKISETDKEKMDSTIRSKISNMGIKRSVEDPIPVAVTLWKS